LGFDELGLSEQLLSSVADAGYSKPTPIQQQAIPAVFMGGDILGCAQTGTGKTASFTLPMIDILSAGRAKARMPRSLILCPTRELAAQVSDNFETYGKNNALSMALLIGGVTMTSQLQALDKGVDVLIATPGRLLDHFERGKILLNDVKILVIDEADRMLDMGFIPDVDRIVSLLPKNRQTLFFSATLDNSIRKIAKRFLANPKEISVAPPSSVADTVVQKLIHTEQKNKRQMLREFLANEEVSNAVIFCNRKRDIGILYRSLLKHGFNAAELHGDLPQSSRTSTLNKFKSGDIQLLIASDVAARGLDIADLSHVVNFDVPSNAEDYVHRIGRTGRAGKKGNAFTFVTSEDQKYIEAITALIKKPIETLKDYNKQNTSQAITDKQRRTPLRRAKTRNAKSDVTEKSPSPENNRFGERVPPPVPTNEPTIGMGDHVPAFLLRR